MVDPFDPYQTWLGIPPQEQPPDHYRLLGIARFERDRVAIEAGMLRQIACLEAVRTAEHAQARLRLILEIRGARSCLLNENRRRVYDQALMAAQAEKVAQGQPKQEELSFAPLEGERVKPSRPPRQEGAAAEQPADSAPPQAPGPPLPVGDPTAVGTPACTAPPVSARSLLDEELAEHFRKRRDEALLESMSQKKGWRRWFLHQTGNKTTIWARPSVLAAVGGLLLLALLGGRLLRGLKGESGDELFQQASDAYRAGAYAQAIAKFNDYLRQFPDHSRVGSARVRLGLARLRQAATQTADWPKAHRTAKTVLPEISSLREFGLEAQPVLPSLLCDIAEGLATEAQKRADPALLKQAQESLTLVEKYVPKSRQPAARLGKIEASLASTRQAIARPKELE